MKTKILIGLMILVVAGGSGFFILKNISQLEETIKSEGKPEGKVDETGPQEITLGEDASEGEAAEELPPKEEIQHLSGALPAPKLLSWQKESGKRVPGGVSSHTIFRNNQYWMYYTSMGGIHLTKSADGLNFQGYGIVLVNGLLGSEQEMVSNSTVFRLKNGGYRMIYEGSQNHQTVRKLYSAISSDGLVWTKEDGVRLEDSVYFYDPKKSMGGNVVFTSVPDIIKLENDCLRMYYTVVDESRIAESCDEGLTWQKRGKIMFDVYPEIVQDPAIIQLNNGKYKLFFSTQDSARTKQWILSASSEDGFNFIIDSGKRIEPASGKARAVDPDVVRLPDGNYRIYYGESFTFEGDFDILSAISKD